MLVRTWNVYHGRTHPPTRTLHLERMVRLVTADRPELVALQELPVWALRPLGRWSGMAPSTVVTMPALGGPLARFLTGLAPMRLRSALTGQANALLVKPGLPAARARAVVLNPEVSSLARLLGAQRRVCHALDVTVAGETVVVANLHAGARPEHVRRALEVFADAERCILCGDFNLERQAVPGFTPPIPGIDQILVRGLELERPPQPWPEERRRLDGLLLSDHAPVEVVVA